MLKVATLKKERTNLEENCQVKPANFGFAFKTIFRVVLILNCLSFFATPFKVNLNKLRDGWFK